MRTTIAFPNDSMRILYWVFFKPITLDNYLKRLDPKLDHRTSLITLWRRGKELGKLAELSFVHIIVSPVIICYGIALFLNLSGLGVDWTRIYIGITVGVALGLAAGVVSGVAAGITTGLGFGTALGLMGGLAPPGHLIGAMLLGVAFSQVWGIGFNMLGSLFFGLLGAGLTCVVIANAGDILLGIVVSTSAFLSYSHLFLYPFELLLSTILARRAEYGQELRLFRFSPVCWDELVLPPLYGLDRHLITIGKRDRLSVQQPLNFVAQSIAQQWAAHKALIELTIYDFERCQTLQEIADLANQFVRLPPKTSGEMEDFLSVVREIAERARAAIESDTLYNKKVQLLDGEMKTRHAREAPLLGRNRQVAARLKSGLENWEWIFNQELSTLQREESIPNVYVSGPALGIKSKVFKGRQDLFNTLERELASAAEQRSALLLFGARRIGKTSTIKRMPIRLGPDVIPVEVDFQLAATVEDTSGLLAFIANQITTNALEHRELQLPSLSIENLRSDSYITFHRWLKDVEEIINTRWILLNLDEYEYLISMVQDQRIDKRVFDFLSGLIQQHHRITVLLSGSHLPKDLQLPLGHHLPNVRTLSIGVLNEHDARELVEKPIPDFPLRYEAPAVNHLIEVTGCHPYLIQATCRELVDALNNEHRMDATITDAKRALDKTLITCADYFVDLWNGPDSDDEQRAVMYACATNRQLKIPELDKARSLEHRDILKQVNGEYCFRVELVRRWVEQWGIPLMGQ